MHTEELQKNNYDPIGVTFQMSLDHFLTQQEELNLNNSDDKQQAFAILDGMKQFRSNRKKCELAKQALAACPNCIEAYLALGMYSDDIFLSLSYFEEGARIAACELGKNFFLQDAHDFYKLPESEAFFTIKAAYAQTLFDIGYMKRAKEEYETILKLNPSDHFQVRYRLLSLYLLFEEPDHFRHIATLCDKDDPIVLYALALYDYKSADLERVAERLIEGEDQNPYIASILRRESRGRYVSGSDYARGSREEADYFDQIFHKAVSILDYLHIFMHQLKQRSE